MDFFHFIFSATLRENLDPLMSHSDAKLLDALKKARLADVVRYKLAPLDPVEGGRGLDAMIDHETTFSAGMKYYFWVDL
jgi:ABC-type multidrug transport system fused ATPase/permease subunit